MRRKNWGWLVGLALVSCSKGGGGGSESYGLEERVEVTGLTFPGPTPPLGTFAMVDAFPALNFDEPILITHAGDGTDRLFVAEQAGRVYVFDNDPGVLTMDVFLDIRPSVLDAGESGFLGLAFDPDYATNGYFYVRYETPTSTPGMDHHSVISRFQVSAGDPNAADPGSETILLEFDNPRSNHNAGCLAFGPDGMLYAAVGDGGGAGDPDEHAQDRTTILGNLLRLAPDGSIPADNPFVGEGGGVREEIWAYGLRNPWRFSFDRDTGDLWLADVGQRTMEEIDVIVRGGNYGWDLFEGPLDYENTLGVPISTTIEPIHSYPRSEGTSVTGGYVYRGTDNPSLVGAYVYADFVSGRVWALRWDGTQMLSNDEIGNITNPSSFGEDEAGELYLTSYAGRVYRVEETAGGVAPPFPQLLSETGLFTDVLSLTPTPGLIEYDVQTPLWSDGAVKRRWIALSGSADITFDPTGAWQFPLGTVLVKHFEIETTPGVIRRLETRVMIHDVPGWQGYTYRWNAQEDDADLLPGAATETLTIDDGLGGQATFDWEYPDRASCLTCHTSTAGRVLGVRTEQLNGDFAYPERTDNQLRAWNHIGLFTTDIGSAEDHPALPRWGDPAAATADLARAYLAVNCASCHQPGGPTPVTIDLRHDLPVASMNVVGVPPTSGDVGLIVPLLIRSGDRTTSVLWERLRLLTPDRMPPLGSHRVDDAAVDVVGRWIDEGAN